MVGVGAHDDPKKTCRFSNTFSQGKNHNTSSTASGPPCLAAARSRHGSDKSKKLIVNCRSPYFAIDYFPEDPTFVEMNISINENTAKMLVERLMGEKEFTGKCLLTKYSQK